MTPGTLDARPTVRPEKPGDRTRGANAPPLDACCASEDDGSGGTAPEAPPVRDDEELELERFHGPLLTRRRERRGLSRATVADVLGLRWVGLVELWERWDGASCEPGDVEPTASQLLALARLFDCSPRAFAERAEHARVCRDRKALRTADGDEGTDGALVLRIRPDEVQRLRACAGLTLEQVARRARVDPAVAKDLERETGLGEISELLRVLSVLAEDVPAALAHVLVVERLGSRPPATEGSPAQAAPGNALRSRREAWSFTVERVAGEAGIGLAAVEAIEGDGPAGVTVGDFAAYCRALGIGLDEGSRLAGLPPSTSPTSADAKGAPKP